jgi:4,5-DOPA dioxygenase extradiol
MTAARMPVLFLGHGSPMNVIEDNAWRRGWAEAARRLPRPKAILCISAHWETRGASAVSASPAPETIHDFGGFPQALFDVRYPAPGDPALAARVAELLAPDPVVQHPTRGLDHGGWSVLLPMYPDADVPVLQLSLDRARPNAWHHEAGRRLAPLRDEGVLILGSGDIVHNLRDAGLGPALQRDCKGADRGPQPWSADRFRGAGSGRGDVDQQRRALSAAALRAGRRRGRRRHRLVQ